MAARSEPLATRRVLFCDVWQRLVETCWSQLWFSRPLDAISHQALLDTQNAALNITRHVNIPRRMLTLSNGAVGPATEF